MKPEPLTPTDCRNVLATAQLIAPVDASAFAPLLRDMRVVQLKPQDVLLRVGDTPPMECFVLDGVLRSWLGDAQGRAVTLDFYLGPCAMTPAIARSRAGQSRIHCEALTAARVVLFEAEALSRTMMADIAMARWGDAVLTQELVRRVDRELALATQPAKERLLSLRSDKPGLEEVVPQHHLASYLGMTPVSLSRLRGQLRRAGAA
ncbi:MAG: Crp/Fnr family transcriptional regulator [Pseudomonadota bacterium]